MPSSTKDEVALPSSTNPSNGTALINTNARVNGVPHPGDVKINVQGAFIVDKDQSCRMPELLQEIALERVTSNDPEPLLNDTNDIRLPNHKAIVSHIAVDVCCFDDRTLNA